MSDVEVIVHSCPGRVGEPLGALRYCPECRPAPLIAIAQTISQADQDHIATMRQRYAETMIARNPGLRY